MNEMYIVSFNSTHHAIRLDKLLDSMLGMNYKDSLWILPEGKLYMDYENYHIKSNPRRYIPSNIVAKLEETIK